jgi:hypothetical protein
VSPTSKAIPITPSDSTDLTGIKQIYVGGAGNLAVRLTRDPSTTITFTAPPVGSVLKLNVTRVMAATTATLLIGLY